MASPQTIKRLMKEYEIIKKDPDPSFDIYPSENNILEAYFMIKGNDGPYKGGYYIGKLEFPTTYPQAPPDVLMCTPSGRFKTGLKICLSNTGYHSETWSPAWQLKTYIIGFISIMYSDVTEEYGLNHEKASVAEREAYAKNSIEYNRHNLMSTFTKFAKFVDANGNIKTEQPKQAVVPKPTVAPQPAQPVQKEYPEGYLIKEYNKLMKLLKKVKKDEKKYLDGLLILPLW